MTTHDHPMHSHPMHANGRLYRHPAALSPSRQVGADPTAIGCLALLLAASAGALLAALGARLRRRR